MRICIIAEGSYPYVTGGVSSWIQMLISNMKQHQFIIYAIGAKEEDRGHFRYDIPDNVEEIHEVFLDEFLKKKGAHGKNYMLNKEQMDILNDLVKGKYFNWNILFETMRQKKIKNLMDFFKSEDFFNVITKSYMENYKMLPFTEYFWMIRSMLIPLLCLIRSNIPQADIYHSVSTGYAGVVGSMAKYLYKKPYIVTEHGIYTREREEELIKAAWVEGCFKDIWIKFFYNMSKCAYDWADKVVTLFNKNRDIEVELGCQENKIEIIPNGVNVEKFKDMPKKSGEDETINIGAVVRLVPIKDIKTMMHSFYIVKKSVNNAKFYIMGPEDEDEEYYEECRKLAENLKLDSVVFTGRVNIKDYIGKMDILVLSSISEGQPLAILEGMAGRKPFVVTDVGSCRELISGPYDGYGEAGFVVPVMDYEEMAEKIVLLSKDENLRKHMGENAYNRVSNIYTIDNFINGYKRVYEELSAGMKEHRR